jgi:hypothetical protein
MKTEKMTFKRWKLHSGTRQLNKHHNRIFLAVILLISISCSKNPDSPGSEITTTDGGPDPNVTFEATLNGISETPPNSSAATGYAVLTFNTETKIFTIVVYYSGMTAIASHIHKGEAGVSGAEVFGFPNPLTSPIRYTSAPLDAGQEADLYANLYYINIHSAEYPAGEIRGQLIKQ